MTIPKGPNGISNQTYSAEEIEVTHSAQYCAGHLAGLVEALKLCEKIDEEGAGLWRFEKELKALIESRRTER